MLEYNAAILQSRSDDTPFTSRFIVNSPAIKTAKWHGALLALVVSPIPADGTERPLGLLRGCGGGGKVSWYRGRETGDSLSHGNYQALQGIGRKSTHRFLDKRGKVFPVENSCANIHVRLLPLRARSRELSFVRNSLACAALGGFPGLIIFVHTKIRCGWLCIVRALFIRRLSMR
jgi:hypothetical protein